MRRGDYRNYYKGHMDKIKEEGRGGGGKWDQLGWGGGWGEKAYNCNWITIKFFYKRKKNNFVRSCCESCHISMP